MKISSQVYDTCKYLSLIVMPALAVFVGLVGPEWDLPKVDAVVKTITATGALLGAVTLVSNVAYNRSDDKYDGVIDPFLAQATTTDDALYIPEMAKRLAGSDKYTGGVNPKVRQKEVLLKVEQPDFVEDDPFPLE